MATTLDAFLSEELDALRQKHLLRSLRVLEGQQLPEACFDGHSVINLSSNNYLGLNTHRRLVEAAKQATEMFGVGSGAVRTIAGTMQIHMELEEAIARFKHVEASVVFQSGFTANAGTVSSILGKSDLIISDELNHAVTNHRSISLTPRWSQDNSKIAYTSYRRGNPDLTIQSLIDNRLLSFPTFGGLTTTPAWATYIQ